MAGNLIVVSAPSGCGKTTLVKKVLEIFPDIHFSVSATTRDKRNNETDGIEYYFITREEFDDRIDNNEFLEWNEHFGNRYGTLKSITDKELEKGKDILLDLDVNGAINVKKNCEKAKLVFIKPPSIETLRERLLNRGTETEETINIRLKRAEEELEKSEFFDYIIVNDILETAEKEIIQLIDKFKKER
jgi:guanylate kinase